MKLGSYGISLHHRRSVMQSTKFLRGLSFLRVQLSSGSAKLDTCQVRKLEVFLVIANTPGITQQEVEKKLELQGPPFSRYTKEMSLSVVDGERKGLDLLDIRPDLSDSRKYSYNLNANGQRLFNEFLKIIGG